MVGPSSSVSPDEEDASDRQRGPRIDAEDEEAGPGSKACGVLHLLTDIMTPPIRNGRNRWISNWRELGSAWTMIGSTRRMPTKALMAPAVCRMMVASPSANSPITPR